MEKSRVIDIQETGHHYKFIDKDGNALIGGDEMFKLVQEGGRLYFTVEEPTQWYKTWKKVRRRPKTIERISTLRKKELITL